MSNQIVSDIRSIAVGLAAMDRMAVELAAQEIERLRRTLSDCLVTVENNRDGLNGAQVGLFIGRLRSELFQ